MPIVKTDILTPFSEITKGMPFCAYLTIYNMSRGEEDPKDHILYKTGANRATTTDKSIVVHIPSDTFVYICVLERKPINSPKIQRRNPNEKIVRKVQEKAS